MNISKIEIMAFNHDSNEGYEGIKWPTEASKDEVYVIHMLADEITEVVLTGRVDYDDFMRILENQPQIRKRRSKKA